MAERDTEAKYEIHSSSLSDPSLKKILQSLRLWLNSHDKGGVYLSDIYKDLFVAKQLARVIHAGVGEEIINLSGITGCTLKDFQLIMTVLVNYTEKNLFSSPERWTLAGILANDFSSLLSFIVDLALYFKCSYPLPLNVYLIITVSQFIGGADVKKNHRHLITSSTNEFDDTIEAVMDDSIEMLQVMDLFERLIDTDEKFVEVCKLLVDFVNNNIGDFGLEITELNQLAGGSEMILLVGVIGNVFIPFKNYKIQPTTDKDREVNIKLFLKLLGDLKVDTKSMRTVDFLAKDLKVIARSVFMLQQVGGGTGK